jgi:hypothetical protein
VISPDAEVKKIIHDPADVPKVEPQEMRICIRSKYVGFTWELSIDPRTGEGEVSIIRHRASNVESREKIKNISSSVPVDITGVSGLYSFLEGVILGLAHRPFVVAEG